jgi:hypothetical protein
MRTSDSTNGRDTWDTLRSLFLALGASKKRRKGERGKEGYKGEKVSQVSHVSQKPPRWRWLKHRRRHPRPTPEAPPPWPPPEVCFSPERAAADEATTPDGAGGSS